jgi:pyruvate dehydrogenase E2 component (dihydrolipoamide acetyltransferase)
MAEFVMPRLGADMEAGTLVAWRRQSGESIRRGEVLAEVETEKGVIDIESFHTGVLQQVLVEPGRKVPVGTVLALIRVEGEPAAAAPAPAPCPSMPAGAGPVRISPLARKIAAELGIDPSSVQGTGPGGSVVKDDIERAAAAHARSAPTPPATEADRKARLRRAIAAAMARSKREIPHYYLATTIDLHRALSWLEARNRERSIEDRLLPGVLLLKTVALALREVPELNATWDGEQVVPGPAIHLGVAIALRGGGLVAPALHEADRLDLDELMRRFRDLVDRARAGSLRGTELSDPTITVTSLGDQGVEAVFGVIYPPQVALVGLGKVVERPWVVEGQVVPRRVVTATLSADHRVSDGHRGGRFLAAVDRLLQEPSRL